MGGVGSDNRQGSSRRNRYSSSEGNRKRNRYSSSEGNRGIRGGAITEKPMIVMVMMPMSMSMMVMMMMGQIQGSVW